MGALKQALLGQDSIGLEIAWELLVLLARVRLLMLPRGKWKVSNTTTSGPCLSQS